MPDAFPWHIPLHDAHCHPLEDPQTLDNLPAMKTAALTVFATRAEDQELMATIASQNHSKSLTKDTKLVPGFGYHPWFSHTLFNDLETPIQDADEQKLDASQVREAHYYQVLTPKLNSDSEEDIATLSRLPALTSLSKALAILRANLVANPLAVVGEIGLDKNFRLPEPWVDQAAEDAAALANRPRGGRCGRNLTNMRVNMEHQATVLRAQLHVAAELGRAVSVHGVGAHGVLLSVIAEGWAGFERESKREKKRRKKGDSVKTRQDLLDDGESDESKPSDVSTKSFPPRICLHSFSGSVDAVRHYFAPEVPAEVYISFAWANNFSTESAGQRAEQVMAWVPEQSLLVESDLHSVGAESDVALEKMAWKICQARKWTLTHGCRVMSQNWWRFITGEENDDLTAA